MADIERIAPGNRVWRRQPGEEKRQRHEPEEGDASDPDNRDDSDDCDDDEHIDVYV